jgi:hypothetical protein
MSSFEGLRSYSQLRLMIIGINRTTTGVLLINAEVQPTVRRIIVKAVVLLPREKRRTYSERNPTAPVRIRPLLIRNMAPTVITAGLAKPSTVSLGVRMPLIASIAKTPMAVRSTEIFSEINNIRTVIRITVTIQTDMMNISSYRSL